MPIFNVDGKDITTDLMRLPELPPEAAEGLGPSAYRWAQERLRHLQRNHPDLLERLRRSNDLNSHLFSIGEDAEQMESHVMSEALRESHKLPFLEGQALLQNRLESIREQIFHDLILQPVPD
jgi:hypothetical protein